MFGHRQNWFCRFPDLLSLDSPYEPRSRDQYRRCTRDERVFLASCVTVIANFTPIESIRFACISTKSRFSDLFFFSFFLTETSTRAVSIINLIKKCYVNGAEYK